MDLSFLDKSSDVTPLLVKLYDSHKLYSLAKDRKPEARAELTAAVSELLDKGLSAREHELIADVLIALIRQAEHDLRKALAEQLSVLENVPLRVVLHVANDEIDVAGSMLRNSPVLGDVDMIYIIKSKSAAYWRELAARASLSETVTDILIDTRDFGTAMTLAENDRTTLTGHAMGVLSEMARHSHDLALPLLRRDEMTREIAGSLYRYVGQALKKDILDRFEIDTDIILGTIDDVILDFVSVDAAEAVAPTPAMIDSAGRFRDKGLLTTQLMMNTLKRGQVQAFMAQFSCYTALPPDTVIEILRQPTGQGLAVAARACGILKQDFVSIYLLTNRLRTRERSVDMKAVNKALHYYESIRPEMAQIILANSTITTH